MEYFSDSYAIIALAEGKQSYSKFQGIRIITSILNIGEIYQITLRKHDKETADNWFNKVNFELLELTSKIIIDAIYFRYLNKKKNLSLTDAVGYTLSLKYNFKFLTGDGQFEDVHNVEFVK